MLTHRGAATGGTGGIPPPPTLKSRVTSYVLVPPPETAHVKVNVTYGYILEA